MIKTHCITYHYNVNDKLSFIEIYMIIQNDKLFPQSFAGKL